MCLLIKKVCVQARRSSSVNILQNECPARNETCVSLCKSADGNALLALTSWGCVQITKIVLLFSRLCLGPSILDMAKEVVYF